MNTIEEMYTYAYNNRRERKRKIQLKIVIRGDTVVMLTWMKHAPMIFFLSDISLEGEDNCCLVVCLSPSSDCDLFRALDKRLALPKSVFILQIRQSAHVIKDGADLFVADQVGTVHAACLRGNLS